MLEAMKQQKTFINLIGWLGVFAILLAYILTNFSLLNTGNSTYLFLNLFGSIAVLYEAYTKKDYQPVVLNLIWALVALIGLVRALL